MPSVNVPISAAFQLVSYSFGSYPKNVFEENAFHEISLNLITYKKFKRFISR